MNPKLEKRREAYGKKILELGSKDENIVVLDADISAVNGTYHFAKKFPERFINVGCAETNLIGVSAGLALAGKKVFASTFAIFASMKACEQVRFAIAHTEADVKIIAPYSGISAAKNGASHHCNADLAIMRAIPNMTVIEPADSISTSKLIEECYKMKGPVYMRLGRSEVPVIYNNRDKFKIGKAVTLRSGKDIAIIACGHMVSKAMDAIMLLEKEVGLSCSLIDMHTIKPLDVDTLLDIVSESKLVVSIEEHNIYGGLGGAIAEILTYYSPKLQLRIGINDIFCESDEDDELRKLYGIDENGIVNKILNYIKDNNIF